jgi:hypothetical protein
MNLEEIKKKETIRVSKKDLLKLLSENEHMTKQITELQTRMTELVEENRRLKLPAKVAAMPIVPPLSDYVEEPFPTYDPNIYFDGANGIR